MKPHYMVRGAVLFELGHLGCFTCGGATQVPAYREMGLHTHRGVVALRPECPWPALHWDNPPWELGAFAFPRGGW